MTTQTVEFDSNEATKVYPALGRLARETESDNAEDFKDLKTTFKTLYEMTGSFEIELSQVALVTIIVALERDGDYHADRYPHTAKSMYEQAEDLRELID